MKRQPKPRLQQLIQFCIVSAICALLGALTMLLITDPPEADGFVDMYSEDKIQFPLDEGPHEHSTEWWYYNGHLEAETGKLISYHISFFAHRVLVDHTIVHVSLLDHDTKKTKTYEGRIPGVSAKRMKKTEFRITADPWVLTLGGASHQVQGRGDTFAFDLRMGLAGPLVMQDGDGIIDFGPAGESYYYTRTRMPTSGRVTLDGEEYLVTGTTWFDHQWGEFRAHVLSWEWFSLQLESGADVMLFALRDIAGGHIYTGGTWTFDEKTTQLTEDMFTMKALDHWKSEASDVNYPVKWKIDIPSVDASLNLRPVKRDSEFDARNSSYNAYWEGPMIVSGTHRGRGFLEVSTAAAAMAK